MRRAVITADDFGLTRANMRTVLEAVDGGAVTRVSVIPNGYAVDEALAEWVKRKETLSLSLHLNLTEGKALSKPSDIPRLAYPDGTFRNAPITLFFKTLSHNADLQKEIAGELALQAAHLRLRAGDTPFFVDGHQHVHMIPMIFEAVMEFHTKHPFAGVRITREPFFLPGASPLAYVGIGGIRHFGLNILARRARRVATQASVPTTDHFLGSLMSGCQTKQGVEAGLLESRRLSGESVEIGMHPGEATADELQAWNGDRAWHTSVWRGRERALLRDPGFAARIRAYEEGTMSQTGSRSLEVLRFIVAGSISTGTNLGFLYVFTDLVGIFYLMSAILSYSIATIVSFSLQKFWAFTHRSTKRAPQEFVLYVGNNILGVVFDLVGLHVLVEYLDVWYLLAQFILLAIIAAWNFFVFRFIIFKKDA